MHRIFEKKIPVKVKKQYSLHSNADKCNFLVLCLKNYTICCTTHEHETKNTQKYTKKQKKYLRFQLFNSVHNFELCFSIFATTKNEKIK